MLNRWLNLLNTWSTRLKCQCKKTGAIFRAHLYIKGMKDMKKIVLLFGLISVGCVAGCSHKCESEPIIEANHKLIVPPNFGNMPK